MLKIYGRNVVKETVYAGKRKIFNLYLDESHKNTEKKFIEFCEDKKIKVSFMPKVFFKKLNLGLDQGFVCEIENYQYKELEDCIDTSKKQFFVILDNLEDPHNLGAILRSADACSIDGIIIPKNNSISLNATVAKVSTGAIEHVNVIEVNNINTCIDKLKKLNFWVVGTDMDAEMCYTEMKFDTSVAVVIGSEGFGMKKLTKSKCDYNVYIPMTGHVNSLNASVSCALIMYEWVRKR